MQVNTASTSTRSALGAVSDMDVRLLRVFKTVVDCGGMAAAELELNIGTSTVSRHIKDLETRLGLTLCRRGRAGFALTPEGEQVYLETLRLLSSVDAFRSRVDEIHQRMGGELHIAVFDKTASNSEAHIGQAIASFRAQAPAVYSTASFKWASSPATAAPACWPMTNCSMRPCTCTARPSTHCFWPAWNNSPKIGLPCAPMRLPV